MKTVSENFFLGVHRPQWLSQLAIPLLVSHSVLRKLKKKFPRAVGPWACDSGAFTEISTRGGYSESDGEFVDRVRLYRDQIGPMVFAAIRDFMCEPFVLARTGKTIEEHQRLSVASFLSLRDLAPEIPWLPVVQGWEAQDYERCMRFYEEAGVRLPEQRLVGIGSVCRRQAMDEAEVIVRLVRSRGITVHAFGFKVKGLVRCQDVIFSSDSAAWSYQARRKPPLEGCSGHINCANCLKYALMWRDNLIAKLEGTPARALAEAEEVVC